MYLMGDFHGAKTVFDKALSLALAMGDKASLGLIEFHYGSYLLFKGNGKSAAEHLQNAIRCIEEVKFLTLLGWAWTGLGEAYLLMGELETARRYMEKGMKAHEDVGLHYLLFYHFSCLGRLHFDLGDLDRAKDFFEQALRLSEKHQEGHVEIISRLGLGRTMARMDPLSEEAERQIRRGTEAAGERKLKPSVALEHHFWGELCARRGEREKSLESLRKAVSLYQESGLEIGVDCWLTETQATLRKLVEEEK